MRRESAETTMLEGRWACNARVAGRIEQPDAKVRSMNGLIFVPLVP